MSGMQASVVVRPRRAKTYVKKWAKSRVHRVQRREESVEEEHNLRIRHQAEVDGIHVLQRVTG